MRTARSNLRPAKPRASLGNWGNWGSWGAPWVLACLPAIVVAQERTPAATPRGVLVIAIDALRADHLSCYGYDRETTPTLDALAAEGVRFSETYASAPLLLPAHIALFTGCEPLLARRVLPEGNATDAQRWHIPDALPRLAVEFLAAGFTTAAFVDDLALAPTFGFDAGFQDYFLSDERSRAASIQAEQVQQWIRARGRRERWFALMHLNDLERCWFVPDVNWESYFQPRRGMGQIPPVSSTSEAFFAIPNERWRGGTRTLGQYEAIYDGHLRRVDEALGRLLGGLRAAGILKDTLVCVVGTYGIQFGEAGLYLRSGRYAMADLHVPWIVCPPSGDAEGGGRGRVTSALASSLDVAPTLLQLAGLEQPSGMQGLSQTRFVVADEVLPDTTYREHAFASCGLLEGVAVVAWPDHCLEFLLPHRTQSSALRRSWFGEDRVSDEGSMLRFYDRHADPHPPLESPVPSPPPHEFEVMKERATRWLENVTLAQRVLQENLLLHERVDAETVRRLQATGYLGPDVRSR